MPHISCNQNEKHSTSRTDVLFYVYKSIDLLRLFDPGNMTCSGLERMTLHSPVCKTCAVFTKQNNNNKKQVKKQVSLIGANRLTTRKMALYSTPVGQIDLDRTCRRKCEAKNVSRLEAIPPRSVGVASSMPDKWSIYSTGYTELN